MSQDLVPYDDGSDDDGRPLTRRQIRRMLPIEVMLHTMRNLACDGDWIEATRIASLAAPYTSPKLTAVAVRVSESETLRKLSDEDLERRISDLLTGDLPGLTDGTIGSGVTVDGFPDDSG